jgi:hypothetical protein
MPPDAYTAQQGDSAPPPAILPCQKCWIAIQLLDEEDQPVPREPYWIRLPDGQILEGTLNDQGSVRIEPIPCGICRVRFPKADAPSMAVAGKYFNADWIAIQLLDEDQQPVEGEPYTITLPDGTTVKGKLDKQGKARHDGIPTGQCRVEFPGLGQGEFL